MGENRRVFDSFRGNNAAPHSTQRTLTYHRVVRIVIVVVLVGSSSAVYILSPRREVGVKVRHAFRRNEEKQRHQKISPSKSPSTTVIIGFNSALHLIAESSIHRFSYIRYTRALLQKYA